MRGLRRFLSSEERLLYIGVMTMETVVRVLLADRNSDYQEI
jgi:hypothetical protein